LSGENSLSDIDEKRSFDERSIKIKNHVPQINKLNIVHIPKKSLNVKNSKPYKNDDMKVEFLSLGKKEDSGNANNQETNRFKRTGKSLTKNETHLAERISEKDSESSCCWDMKMDPKYHNTTEKNAKIIKHEKGTEGKLHKLYETGKREVISPDGTIKQLFEDGYSVVHYKNGNKKQTYPDGKVVFYFQNEKVTQTTFRNGLKVCKFNNGQIEKYFPDGSKEITFPDGTTQVYYAGDQK